MGGGSSGKVEYPQYMEFFHWQTLDNFQDQPGSRPWASGIFPNVGDAMKAASSAVGGNPYAGALAYNPDPDIANVQDTIDDWNDVISADFGNFLQETVLDIDAAIQSPEDFNSAATVYQTQFRRQHYIGMARTNAMFLDIGALQTSNYQMWVGQQESLINQAVNEAIVGHEERRDTHRITMIMDTLNKRLASREGIAHTQNDASKSAIVAKHDQKSIDQQFEIDEAHYDLGLFQYGSNVLAGIAGSGHFVAKQSTAQRLMGAAGNGIAKAALGFATGGPIGAAAGGIMGVLGSLGAPVPQPGGSD